VRYSAKSEVQPQKVHHDQQFCEAVEVDRLQVALEAEGFSGHGQHDDDHGDPGKNGSGDEVRAQNG